MSTVGEAGLLAGPEVQRFMADVEARLQAVTSWSPGAAGAAAGMVLAAGGKRLRPLLVKLAAPDAAGRHDDLVRAACAVELIHSATLVHDDVLDHATLRRGRPTVWARQGEAVATATGDHVFARAFSVLCETGDAWAIAELARCCEALALGEALQVHQSGSAATTPQQYLERCGLKTGRLFATACALGGRIGGLGDAAVDALARYGRNLGLAFQIADDVLDCAGDPEATGKSLGTDLLDGTSTLPILLAARSEPLVAAAIRRPPAPAEVLGVLARVAASGALDEARDAAREFARRADVALDELEDDLDIRPLRAIARRVVDREA
jgi:geranylgeranyl pyrophosphate synthase